MTESSGPKDESTAKLEGQKVEIPTHPLVSKLLRDSDPPGNFVVLVGYCGPSKKPNSVRLYLGLDFGAYYEIPRDGIGYIESVDPNNENSPTNVVVKATTKLELVQVSSQSAEVLFLQGDIASDYLGKAVAAFGGQFASPPCAVAAFRVPRCTSPPCRSRTALPLS